MPGSRLTIVGLAVSVGAAMVAVSARAQAVDDKFWLQVSGFLANVDTDVSISPAANPGAGTGIDLEEDLGLDDDALLPAFYAGARLGGGFVMTGEYYSLGRDSTATISRAITVEDVTYPVNASVTAGFDSDIYRFTLGYSFIRSDSGQLGVALGVHATDIAFSISGQGSAGGAGVSSQIRKRDVLAPLPTLGLYGSFELVPGITFGARADYLSLKINEYDGGVLNLQAQVSYRFTDNIGIGAGYRYVDYDLDVEKPNYVGSFDYRFWGPSVFLEVGF